MKRCFSDEKKVVCFITSAFSANSAARVRERGEKAKTKIRVSCVLISATARLLWVDTMKMPRFILYADSVREEALGWL